MTSLAVRLLTAFMIERGDKFNDPGTLKIFFSSYRLQMSWVHAAPRPA
jgi:hypothetical protein